MVQAPSRIAIFLFSLLLVASGCKKKDELSRSERESAVREMANKDLENQQAQNATTEETQDAPPPPRWAPVETEYRPSETIRHDLVHTQLDVRFDWEKRYLLGQAWLTLKPYFYASDSLVLDAKGFDINAVEVLNPEGANKSLSYDYDGLKLLIQMDRTYQRNEEFTVYIDYTAKPCELNAEGGTAITGRQGLYFINPDGKLDYKPQQIWTQGETESSSCWFPTIDAPNQRTTQEIAITVEDRFETLSNGLKVSSKPAEDGYRTDVWRMDIPHAPYLFAMAIGDFAVVEDEWNGKPVLYYVEHEYAPYAKLVFGDTPEMIEFFSEKMGVEFPWPKYAQVCVRDFVSGAMENTTATIHMESVIHDNRAHLDEPHHEIIAHELFHHWFGDLVTCESWANIALNEAFATYGEALWAEYKYGDDLFAYQLDVDLQNYLAEAISKREPLIRFHYIHRDDVFDAHSYQKGGRILHMLRTTIGDDAFFEGLEYYLETHKHTPVEVHDLRIAFEETTGRDLNWFFNQWFLSPGHPELRVAFTANEAGDSVYVRVQQTQNLEYMPTYRLPVTAEMLTAAGRSVREIEINSTDTTFVFATNGEKILNVDLDSEQYLLARKKEKKPVAFWMAQFRNAKNYKQRQLALDYLSDNVDRTDVFPVFRTALQDTFWAVRRQALSVIESSGKRRDDEIIATVQELALKDPKSHVRRKAIDYLASFEPEDFPELKTVFETALNDSSYQVCAAALGAVYTYDTTKALQAARSMENYRSDEVREAVAGIYMAEDVPEAPAYMLQTLKRIGPGYTKMFMLQSYGGYVAELEGSQYQEGLEYLKYTAKEDQNWYIRYGAAKALMLIENEEVEEFLQDLKETESHPRLQELYESEL